MQFTRQRITGLGPIAPKALPLVFCGRHCRLTRRMKATLNHSAMHLDTAHLVAAAELCPICHSQIPRHVIALIQQEPPVHLLSCPNCLGCSASHMPKGEVLDSYYGGYYHGDGPRITLAQVDCFVNNLLRVISFERKTSELRLLDFGGG